MALSCTSPAADNAAAADAQADANLDASLGDGSPGPDVGDGSPGSDVAADAALDTGPVEPLQPWARAIGLHQDASHACAVLHTGEIACWGANDKGQLGARTKNDLNHPRVVTAPWTFTAVSPGVDHTCAIETTGDVWCWGHDDGVARTTSGSPLLRVPLVTQAVALSAQGSSHVALTAAGQVFSWPVVAVAPTADTVQPLATPAPSLRFEGASAVVANESRVCVLDGEGALWCWAPSAPTDTPQPPGAGPKPTKIATPPAEALALAGKEPCVLDVEGVVWCWRTQGYGPPALHRLVAPAAGGWDFGSATQPAWTPLTSLVAASHGLLATSGDGRIWSGYWVGFGTGAARVGPATSYAADFYRERFRPEVVQLGGGDGFQCALTQAGTVWCAGDDAHGQLGQGFHAASERPVQVSPFPCTQDAQCPQADPCWRNRCQVNTGLCVQSPARGAACDDDDRCSDLDRCDAQGRCQGTHRVCDDGDPCTYQAACDPLNGVCGAGLPKGCEDGDPCTLDTCDSATGACTHTTKAGCTWTCSTHDDCSDGAPCTDDRCEGGVCAHPPTIDGARCGDLARCSQGACLPWQPKGWARSVHMGPKARYACVVRNAGGVACWGHAHPGLLPDMTTQGHVFPTLVPGLEQAARVWTQPDGLCWQAPGQGVRCRYESDVPPDGSAPFGPTVALPELGNPRDIVGGWGDWCALRADHTVWCWGQSVAVVAGWPTPAGWDPPRPIHLSGVRNLRASAKGYCALRFSGEVRCWGRGAAPGLWPERSPVAEVYPRPTSVPLPKARDLFMDEHGLCALTPADRVVCVGDNQWGLLGRGSLLPTASEVAKPVATPRRFVAVSGALPARVALDAMGRVWRWGEAPSHVDYTLPWPANLAALWLSPKVEPQLKGVVQLASNGSVWCALSDAGAVFCQVMNFLSSIETGGNSGRDILRVVDQACESDADCAQGDPCFVDTCQKKTGQCARVVQAGAACENFDGCLSASCSPSGLCRSATATCSP